LINRDCTHWLLLREQPVAAGLAMTRKKSWALVVSSVVILCIASITIVQLRDPLGLKPQYQYATETWSYVVWLFWSCVVGLTLPAIGLYVRSRGRESHLAGK
jgi:hypothetical protein